MARVDLKSARTTEMDPARAAEDLMKQLGSAEPKLVTLFAAHARDQLALNRAVRERLPKGTRLLGASTGGEVDNQGIHQGTVVMSAMTGDFEVGLGVGRNLAADAIAAGVQATASACAELGVRPHDLDPRRNVGVVIDDGFKYKKEELLLGVLEKNPALTLVGGGANNDNPYGNAPPFIHVDGEVIDDCVLLALFKTSAPWGALRTHWYEPTGRTMTLTKVDESCTRALEIDGQPAAKRYAELLDVPIDELEFGKPRGFANMPTALRVGREFFIRAPWQPLPDGSVMFANLLEEGTEFEIMQLGDMAGSTKKFFTEELPRRVPNPTASLLFHCTARDWFARRTGKFEDLSATFAAAPPSCGYNVHFECYNGFSINTTLTVLAFGHNDA